MEKRFLNKMAKKSQKDSLLKPLAQNKYAKFQYNITETIESGIELLGTEVKSIRSGEQILKQFLSS